MRGRRWRGGRSSTRCGTRGRRPSTGRRGACCRGCSSGLWFIYLVGRGRRRRGTVVVVGEALLPEAADGFHDAHDGPKYKGRHDFTSPLIHHSRKERRRASRTDDRSFCRSCGPTGEAPRHPQWCQTPSRTRMMIPICLSLPRQLVVQLNARDADELLQGTVTPHEFLRLVAKHEALRAFEGNGGHREIALEIVFSVGSQTHRQNLPHDPDYRDPSPARVSRGRYRKQLIASSTWEGKLFAFSGDPSILVCHSTLANQISRHQTCRASPLLAQYRSHRLHHLVPAIATRRRTASRHPCGR